ncbi:hypothetical protein PCANC_08145 [Puccinia coronata f. sp. avenae]|uniref:Uncharacterized protein n=1 Tax=Puccinia coronata f. sp. avenae TaxID=200324 RepID=A0A2N5VLV4_9BASI|nr:hypothetical protein PCANC_08145 [Puccinia coronata f. sp. avenae]
MAPRTRANQRKSFRRHLQLLMDIDEETQQDEDNLMNLFLDNLDEEAMERTPIFTYKMYTRVGYKRKKIREEYRRNPEEYTIYQHHRINNKEELHQQQAGNTDDGSSTRSGHRGKKGKKDQEEERPRP